MPRRHGGTAPPPPEQSRRGTHGAGAGHRKWLSSFEAASAWARRFDLERDLARGGGLVFYQDVFPVHVARGIAQDLLDTPDAAWQPTEADEDQSANNISHAFLSTKSAIGLDAVARVLSLLAPGVLHVFSAAKYTRSHHIDRHDDRAYTPVLMDDGSVQECSRDVAVIVYLSERWSAEQGGVLLDLEAGPAGRREYVPQFNSAVCFRIPRWHAVTPVRSQHHPRLSIFGWFLVPGRKYPLSTGGDSEAGGDEGEGAPSTSAGAQPSSKARGKGQATPQQEGDTCGGGRGEGSHGGKGVGGGKRRRGCEGEAVEGGGEGGAADEPLWRPGDGSILKLGGKQRKGK